MNELALGASARKTKLWAAFCLAFAAASLFALPVGLLGVLFFGMGGWILWRRAETSTSSLVLTPEGIRPMYGGLVPWRDVESIGTTRMTGRVKIVGVRLSSYDAFLASLPEQIHANSRRMAWASMGLGMALAPLNWNAKDVATAAAQGDLKSLVNWELLSIPKRDLAAQFLWCRKQYGGYDLAWPASALAGKPDQIAQRMRDFAARHV